MAAALKKGARFGYTIAASFSEGKKAMDNLLYYGDNLEILRRYAVSQLHRSS